MVVADDQTVDDRAIFRAIRKLEDDVTVKFDKLSEQVGELKGFMLQSQAYNNAHNLPNKVDALFARTSALELARAAEQSFPAKLSDHEDRLETLEKREHQRDGRRNLFEGLAIVATLIGGLLAVVQLYQWFKGR